jgi:hypothetical protein
MRTRARDIFTPDTVPTVAYFACDDQRRARRPRGLLETDGNAVLVDRVVGEAGRLTIRGSTVKAEHARAQGVNSTETRNRVG